MLCPAVPTTEEALTSRLLHSTIQSLEIFSIFLGKELGLYAALSGGARMTPAELARASGVAARYAREWLEQQAVAGLVRVESADASADERRYWLPVEHVNVLVNEQLRRDVLDEPASEVFLARIARQVVERRERYGGHAHPALVSRPRLSARERHALRPRSHTARAATRRVDMRRQRCRQQSERAGVPLELKTAPPGRRGNRRGRYHSPRPGRSCAG